jgi:hypothetical protein
MVLEVQKGLDLALDSGGCGTQPLALSADGGELRPVAGGHLSLHTIDQESNG